METCCVSSWEKSWNIIDSSSVTADSDVIHSSSLPYFHDNKLFQHGCTALNTGDNTCMCGAQTDLLHTVCKRVCRLVIYAPHSSSYSANHTLHSQESQHALHLFALNVIKCLIHVIFVNRLVILQIRKKNPTGVRLEMWKTLWWNESCQWRNTPAAD